MPSHVRSPYLVVAVTCFFAAGCHRQEPQPSESIASSMAAVTVSDAGADSGSCPTMSGQAWRDYGPPTKWQDFEQTFSTPFSFAIPSSLPVTTGNAGNKDAVIEFQNGNNHPRVKCHYLGGGSAPHPTEPADVQAGLTYRFNFCDDKSPAGTVVQATDILLHVQDGDQKDPANRTVVGLAMSDASCHADAGAPDGGIACIPANCDDGNPCSVDACTPTGCVHSAVTDGTACNDGNACTQSDTCQAGTCTGASPVTCATADQCHAAGTCDPGTGKCSNPVAADGSACSDGNACTQTDACQSGACVGANPVACAAADQCHVAGTCDTATGTCSRPAAPDGTSCSDGNACTQTDMCQAGTCTGANPIACAAADQCHVGGVCDPGTGACSNPAAPDGTSCSDGNACTQTDACQAGACTGASPVTCAASDQCHVAGACDPKSGTCSNPTAANGTACSDGNACTQTDTCQAGACTGANPVTCAASDQCHVAGTCDATSGKCSNPVTANGTACDDANACTKNDACTAGVCGGAAYSCTAADCQASSTCDGNGGCTVANKADGTACTADNVSCTSDICQSGACAHPLQANQCFIAGACVPAGAMNPTNTCQRCNPAMSTSAWTTSADGATCDDGNGCTQTDTCHAGTCGGANPIACAADACHLAGVCNPSTGKCANPARPDGSVCDDGNACTQADACAAGVCAGASPVTCTAADACHVAGTCDPSTGACSSPPAPDGTKCSDGNACTQTDTCHAGTCDGSNFVACAPRDACHVGGACNPITGSCTNPAAANGTDCGANQVCNIGACVPAATSCAPSQTICKGICTSLQSDAANCGACGNACAQGASCAAGTCIAAEVMASCGLPTGSMSVLPGPTGVTAYLPAGTWTGTSAQGKGVQRVVLEGGAEVAPIIPTPDVVNSCASNWVTGETVCVANGKDIYIIKGETITATLTSGATGATDFSGGSCWNCGVAIDAARNRATIVVGLGPNGSAVGALQFLDLNTKTLSAPFSLAGDHASEDIAIDSVRQLTFSPGEQGDYQVLQSANATTPTLFDNKSIPPVLSANTGMWDSAAEDCTTGIALATDEHASIYTTKFAAHLVLLDMTQATYTAGSPGTWTAPFSQPVLTGLPTGANTEMTGIAVAPGSHLGIVAEEGGPAIIVFQLPATSGSGTPQLVDWAAVNLGNGWDSGVDPHNVSAYTSPSSGRVTGVLSNFAHTRVARVDLQEILDAPRVSGSHNVQPSFDVVGRGTVTFIPVECTTARTLSDVNNCGACGHACAAEANSDPLCIRGNCSLYCHSGTADCNGNYGDGCESVLATDPANCGACGHSCAAANATGICSAGTCYVQCAQGFSDCDGKASNGCETSGACLPLTLSASGPTSLAVGATATYVAQVTEPVPGRTVSYAWSATGPAAVTFSAPAASTTTAVFSAPGAYVVKIEVSDGFSGAIATLNVQAAYVNKPPVVTIGSDVTLAPPAMTAQLSGTATDDGLPNNATLSATWTLASGPAPVTIARPTVSIAEPGPLNAATAVSFVYPGTYSFRLAVSDSNLTSSATQTVVVNAPTAIGAGGGSPGASPTVTFGVADDQVITQPTRILATISDGDWLLERRLGGRDDVDTAWTVMASGTGTVNGTSIATFDPTLMLNGIYTLRLSSANSAGTTSTDISVSVDGRMKIGNFTLAFTDLTTAVGNLPLTVTRTYDSRDKTKGDFGFGWRLGIADVRVEKSGKVGAYWQQQFIDDVVFSQFCLSPIRAASVAFTFPNGRQYRFVPQASPQCVFGSADTAPDIVWVSTSDPNNSTIQLAETGTSAFTGSAVIAMDVGNGVTELHTANGDIWDPRRFTLTIEDGSVWMIDQDTGVSKVTDRSGNFVQVTPGGILHSSGKQVVFARDAQNRITSITDPNGKAMTYSYDAHGDLAMYTDRAKNVTQFAYGSNHDLVDIQDPLGRQAVRNTYDDHGRLIETKDALGNRMTYAADLDANQERVTDRLGHATTYTYNERGDITQKIDATGAVWSYTVDIRGNVLTQTDPLGHTTTSTYDGADNVLTQTDALGHVTTNTYGRYGEPLTTTDPLGRTTTNEYDGAGNLVATMDPLGNLSRSTYDGQGNLLTRVDPTGNTTRYEYDGAGHILQQFDANIMWASDWYLRPRTFTYDANGNRLSELFTRTAFNGGSGQAKTTYVYDAMGRRLSSTKNNSVTESTTYTATGKVATRTDPNGRVTTYSYDELDRLIGTRLPDGTATSQTYDAENRRATSTDAAGNMTRYTYDAVGRLTRTTFADGTSQSTVFDSVGHAVQAADELGHVTWTAYDAAGRVTTTTDATGAATRYEYDAAGNRTLVVDALGRVTSYAYDGDNRVVATTYADGNADATLYDAAGRVAMKIDTLGRGTRFGYSGVGQLMSVTDALGNVTQYTYDETGARLSIVDANQHTTSFWYDFATGAQNSRHLPDGSAENEAVDAAGRVMQHFDFLGRKTTFTRDAMGRLLARAYPDGTLVGFTYTPTGRRATMTDARGTTVYAYDVRDRLVQVTYPDGRQLRYGYDARGERTSLTAAVGTQALTTTTAYDAAGRLSAVTDPLGRTFNAQYDVVGNRTSLSYPNTTATSYSYDANNRLTNLTTAQQAGSQAPVVVQSNAYTLDASGKRTQIVENDGTVRQYGYDGIDRLTSEAVTGALAYAKTFTYDAVGNRRTQTTTGSGAGGVAYGYDIRDRLTTENGTTYGYDANGNVLSKSGEASYEWDPENRLSNVRMADGTSVLHTYDADGNRVRTAVAPPTGAPIGCTGTSASFVRRDDATKGNWKGTYGADGNYINAEPPTAPAYGSVTVSNASSYTWAASTTDVRALQTPDASGNRIASMWYTSDTETFHVTTTDNRVHTVALYFLDWDTNVRAQSVTVKTPSGTVLDAARSFAGFNGGAYAVYTVCGSVDFEVARTGPYNADVMGVFLSTPAAPTATDYLVDPSGGLSQVVAETDASGNLTAHYVRLGDQLLAVMRPGGAGGAWATRFVYPDAIGSVRALSDESGAVVDTRAYEAFGTRNVEAGSETLAYGFAGEPLDSTTHLAYHRARWMDSRSGRFSSMDPETRCSGLHCRHYYWYGDDQPTQRVDPSGRDTMVSLSITVGIAGILAMTGSDTHLVPDQLRRRHPPLAFRAYAEDLARNPGLSDCKKLKLMADYAESLWRSPDRVASGLVQGLTERSGVFGFPSDREFRVGVFKSDPYYAGGFHQTGFRPEFIDPAPANNQVRHFVWWFYAGFELLDFIAEKELKNEDNPIKPEHKPDYDLGIAAIALANGYNGSGLGAAIDLHICEE